MPAFRHSTLSLFKKQFQLISRSLSLTAVKAAGAIQKLLEEKQEGKGKMSSNYIPSSSVSSSSAFCTVFFAFIYLAFNVVQHIILPGQHQP